MKIKAAIIAGLAVLSLTPSSTANHWHECLGKRVTHRGTFASEVIYGTADNDVIIGLGGNDVIYGLGGNDRLCGNGGGDGLVGGEGFDRGHGGRSSDYCLTEATRKC